MEPMESVSVRGLATMHKFWSSPVPSVQCAMPKPFGGLARKSSLPASGSALRVSVRGLVKLRYKHRRNVRQAVLALRTWKMITVPPVAQFVRDLVNDESGIVVRGERVER